MKVLIPGSFDPPTNGHIDVIQRCSQVFDEVLVGVVVNPSKKSLFTTETRERMLNEILSETSNVCIKTFEGLLVDFAKANNIQAIVKGLRAMTDFDYEFQMAQMNANLADFETIFIPASPEYGINLANTSLGVFMVLIWRNLRLHTSHHLFSQRVTQLTRGDKGLPRLHIRA